MAVRVGPRPAGYRQVMSDSDPSEHDKLMDNDQESEESTQDEVVDQDSEPTMTAPDEDRPTGQQT